MQDTHEHTHTHTHKTNKYGNLSNTSLHSVCVCVKERVIGGGKRGRRMTDCMLTLVYAFYLSPLYVSPPLSVVYLVVMNRLPARHCSSHKEGTLAPCPSLFIRIYLSIHPLFSPPPPPPLSTSLHLFLCFHLYHLSLPLSLPPHPPILSAGASQTKETSEYIQQKDKVMETWAE